MEASYEFCFSMNVSSRALDIRNFKAIWRTQISIFTCPLAEEKDAGRGEEPLCCISMSIIGPLVPEACPFLLPEGLGWGGGRWEGQYGDALTVIILPKPHLNRLKAWGCK